jgi:hypothetical protein
MRRALLRSLLTLAIGALGACTTTSQPSSGLGSPPEAGASSGDDAASAGSAQTPPFGEASLVAWLATGQYKQWHCEPAVHAARGPSVHTPFDRVCSNDVLSAAAAAGGTAPWPAGAAEVKEIYMAADDPTPTGGYAVSVKTAADSASGAAWYYYERFDGTLYADGLGTGICVDCHATASATSMTSPGAHDFVFTPVP